MLKRLSKALVILCFITSSNSFAQSYVFIPGTTYITNLDTGQIGILAGITFSNTGTSSLNFSWNLISQNILSDCSFAMCNNGECLGNLPVSGTMSAIDAGQTGFLKFHMNPGKTMGTNIFKYTLTNGSKTDTLTYIVVVGNPTGIANYSNNNMTITTYPNPAVDLIYFTGIKKGDVELYNLNGSQVLKNTFSSQNNSLNCEKLDSGIYFYKILDAGSLIGSGRISVSH